MNKIHHFYCVKNTVSCVCFPRFQNTTKIHKKKQSVSRLFNKFYVLSVLQPAINEIYAQSKIYSLYVERRIVKENIQKKQKARNKYEWVHNAHRWCCGKSRRFEFRMAAVQRSIDFLFSRKYIRQIASCIVAKTERKNNCKSLVDKPTWNESPFECVYFH